ncbi:hypothetical protein TNCV_2184741 [Trichonephila clavipes]|nr:hypothetical protein TNCV_2184741 [Trichonephila clavipes]
MRCRWVGVKGSTRNGRHDSKCSARSLRMVRKDTGAPIENVTCAKWRPMKQLAVRGHFYDLMVLSKTALSRAS